MEDRINSELELIEKSLDELEFREVLNKISSRAISDSGKELISGLRPDYNIISVANEHDKIAEMLLVLTEDDRLPLETLPDIKEIIAKTNIENAVLQATELLEFKDTIRNGRLLKKYFEIRSEKYPAIFSDIENIHQDILLEKHINDAIDDSGEVKNTASRELSRIRKAIFGKSNRLRSRLSKILKKVVDEDLAQEEFVTLREGRFVLPVKAEHKRHIPGIIHGISQTGSTVFLEPAEITEMNNELSLLHNEEKREIYRILKNLTQEIGSQSADFNRTVDILYHLDTILARAKYALDYGGIKPEISDDNYIYLKNIRHPLLVHTKGLKEVKPLSVEFSKDKRGHLISGPNAGGKTVALKSIGLNIAMALGGIFPLGECKTNYRTIFSSIGDHQSIENDLSTFSSQIMQLKEIIDYCSPQALILVDEIGSGTDPQEGAALASGFLDSLLNINAFFVVTTHQSSLKTYALNRDEIENDSLEFDSENLKPTYHFLTGIPGNSYAFVLAKQLGLPEIVLERAGKYLGSGRKELEKSLETLHQYTREIEKLRLSARDKLIEAVTIKEKYDKKFSDIKLKRNEYIREAKDEAADVLSGANALIEKAIKDIKEQEKNINEIKKEFKAGKKIFEKTEAEKPTAKKVVLLKVGDSVLLEDSNSTGVVISIDDKTNLALVEFNGIKISLPVNKLQKTKPEKEKKKNVDDYVKFDLKTKIDLRGKRAEEALRELDEYLSEVAVNDNHTIVTIVHGKGTGALRKAVTEFLENNHYVKNFRLGELVEGGDGVTIAEL